MAVNPENVREALMAGASPLKVMIVIGDPETTNMPRVVTLAGKMIEVKAVFAKAAVPMIETPDPMVTDARALSPLNADEPIVVTPEPIVTDARVVMLANADAPMFVTLFGIETDASRVFLNAWEPMLRTFDPKVTDASAGE